jgi:MerR family mercuric resistance operon transcriptional regulator
MEKDKSLKKNLLPISKAAKVAGVGVETIRYYERQKLIEQPQFQGRTRYYSDEVLEKIRFIKRTQRLGFTLQEIKSFLQMQVRPNEDCAPIKKKTQEKIIEVQGRIESLNKILKALQKIEHACSGHETTQSCSILDGLKAIEL